MKFSKLITGSASVVLAMSGSATQASIIPQSTDISGVARVTGGGSPLSAVYSIDPFTGTLPGYTLSNPPNLSNGGYTGVNIPPYRAGLFPTTIGNFTELGIAYEAPAAGPNADPSFKYVVQTTDGKYHITATTVTSKEFASGGGYNFYGYGSINGGADGFSAYQAGPNDFVPPIVNLPVNKMAAVFYGTSQTRHIFIEPNTVGGTSGAFLLFADSIYRTTADAHFNFEFNTNNY